MSSQGAHGIPGGTWHPRPGAHGIPGRGHMASQGAHGIPGGTCHPGVTCHMYPHRGGQVFNLELINEDIRKKKKKYHNSGSLNFVSVK